MRKSIELDNLTEKNMFCHLKNTDRYKKGSLYNFILVLCTESLSLTGQLHNDIKDFLFNNPHQETLFVYTKTMWEDGGYDLFSIKPNSFIFVDAMSFPDGIIPRDMVGVLCNNRTKQLSIAIVTHKFDLHIWSNADLILCDKSRGDWKKHEMELYTSSLTIEI